MNVERSPARCRDRWAISGRGPRHVVPGRSRRPPAGTAAQAAAGAAGAAGRAPRQRRPGDAGERASHRGDEPGSRGNGSTTRLPRRSLLPVERVPDPGATAARAAEDIPLLVTHFVRQFAERQGKCIDDIPDGIIDTLRHTAWPGNVRELQNVIERAVIATTGRTLQMPSMDRRIHRPGSSARTLAEVERDHIVATLQATNGVLGGWDGAAARLGLSRTTLISRMQRLGISGERSRTSASQPAFSPAATGKRGQRLVAG